MGHWFRRLRQPAHGSSTPQTVTLEEDNHAPTQKEAVPPPSTPPQAKPSTTSCPSATAQSNETASDSAPTTSNGATTSPPATETTWTHAEHQQALQLVRIYQRQLYNAGFNPRAILARTRPRKMSRRAYAKITPGWFPDPTGFAVWRYWNGARWTHHLDAAVPANNEPLHATSP